MYFNDIIVTKFHIPKSSILDLPREVLYDKNKLMSILENNYIGFDPARENIMINSKAIYNSNYTEEDLRRSILIVPKFMGINIKSQYDEPYNRISNQCSWISKEFVNNKNNIINCIRENNINGLKNIYDECMINGTNNRTNFGLLTEGENIEQIGINNLIESTTYGDPIILQNLPNEIVSKIVKPNINMINYSLFSDKVKNLNEGSMMLINRDGQTFVFLKLYNSYYVFDSHIREIKICNLEEMYNYILENNKDGFFYILFSVF